MFLKDKLMMYVRWAKTADRKQHQYRKRKKGISTIIVTVFLVVVLMVGIGAMTWSLGLQNNFGQIIAQKNTVDIDRVNERIEIRDIKIENDKLNMTVVNTGSVPVKLVKIWITNTTAATEWHQNYGLNNIINPGYSLSNLGTTLPIMANNASSYKISVVTEKGSSASFRVTSPKGESPQLSLIASPLSTPTGQDITLILAVTNSLINSNVVHSIKPVLNWTKVEVAGGSIAAGATLVSGPTPTIEKSLAFSETAYFKWIYNIVGDPGDRIDFNATLVNAIQGSYVTESVNVIMDTFAEQSAVSLQTLGLSTSLTSVKTGTCSISDGSTLIDCPISPALTDREKSFLIFQATSNDNTPSNSNVRCFIQSISNIKCDRNGTVGIVNVQWQVAEFSEGVKVEHLTPPCYGATTTVDISPVAAMSKSFLLFSSQKDGTDQDGSQFRTIELKSPGDTVEIKFSSGSCSSVRQALQIVQFNGTSVERGMTGTMPGSSTTVSLSPSVDTQRAMLLYSWRTAGSGADMCERMVRGTLTSTQITFTRGCTGTSQIDAISWEVIEFTEGGLVRPLTVSMNNNDDVEDVSITPVDPSKSIVFAGGQWANGQALGQGSYSLDDTIGAMTGRFVLTNPSNVQVVRNNTQDTATWDAFVVQFGNYVIYPTAVADLEFKIKNTGTSKIWIDNNSRIVLNNTVTKLAYGGIIKSWKNETSLATGNINNTLDSDAIEKNVSLTLVFAEPRMIPGNPGSGTGVKAIPGVYSAYIRLSGYDELGKFVLRIPFGTVEVPTT